MNNSVQIFRKLLTFRGCSRILSSRYSDDRKVNDKLDGKEFTSCDSSSVAEHTQIQINNKQGENGSTSSATPVVQATTTESIQGLGDKKLSTNTVGYVEQSDIERPKYNSPIMSETKLGDKPETELREVTGSQYHAEDGSVATGDPPSDKKVEAEGFFAAYQKQEKLLVDQSRRTHKSAETFASMLRESPFIDMGDPVGKVVVGEIYLIVEDDLYIDFGWKFHAVCPKPRKNPGSYVPGAKVLLRIKELELSTKFLGEKSYVSLLEADCDIIGLAFRKDKQQKTEAQQERVE